MIDELAHAANMDAYQFRLKMTTHPGWLGVLNAVATASNWQTKVSALSIGKGPIVTGRGIAIAGENHANADVYAGVVAEVQVHLNTGKVTRHPPLRSAGLRGDREPAPRSRIR